LHTCNPSTQKLRQEDWQFKVSQHYKAKNETKNKQQKPTNVHDKEMRDVQKSLQHHCPVKQ
jgi:hypothetical protein